MHIGKYRLIAELGHGGMADVFLAATETTFDFTKLVVLKRLRDHLADDPEFVTMFLDEARIAARLNHPNVVQTLEVGGANNDYYIAMEYLDGQPIHRVLRHEFPLAMKLAVLDGALSGLEYAHELRDYDGSPLNIVHRDVSPQNIFLTYDGQVKIVDFGIAKASGKIHQTKQGIIKGKVSYMAPEQALGLPVDRRADVFAVGVMLYEAIAGRRVWQKKSEKEILTALVHRTLPPIPDVPGIPASLRDVCAKAFHADPDRRYATAAEMQIDLEQVMEEHYPRPSARRIGRALDSMFHAHRKRIHEVIEKHVAAIVRKPSVGLVALRESDPNLGAASEHDSSEGPSGDPATKIVTGSQARAEPSQRRSTRSVSQPAVKTSRTTLLTVVVLLAAGAAAATAVSLAAKKNEPAVAPVQAKMTLTLRAVPLETQFRVDDGPPLENPFIGRFPQDGALHHIAATARGYVPSEQFVRFNEDISVRFVLTSASTP